MTAAMACFRPLTGYKLQLLKSLLKKWRLSVSVPLRGINCNRDQKGKLMPREGFPSPYGV